MIIRVCDCCNQQAPSLQSVAVGAEHGMLLVFDIGPCCIDKPFAVPPSARRMARGTLEVRS